jgi:phage-related protein
VLGVRAIANDITVNAPLPGQRSDTDIATAAANAIKWNASLHDCDINIVVSRSCAAHDSLGFELYRVQCGLDPKDWKPMNSVGPGVKEIRVRDAAGIFRMIYLATRPEGVYVLHCFQKKTQRTSRSDLDLATKRFKSIAR